MIFGLYQPYFNLASASNLSQNTGSSPFTLSAKVSVQPGESYFAVDISGAYGCNYQIGLLDNANTGPNPVQAAPYLQFLKGNQLIGQIPFCPQPFTNGGVSGGTTRGPYFSGAFLSPAASNSPNSTSFPADDSPIVCFQWQVNQPNDNPGNGVVISYRKGMPIKCSCDTIQISIPFLIQSPSYGQNTFLGIAAFAP